MNREQQEHQKVRINDIIYIYISLLIEPYSTSQDEKADRRYVCKWGSECRTIGDPNHRAKYSHPKSE